jgi:hypothetical protein
MRVKPGMLEIFTNAACNMRLFTMGLKYNQKDAFYTFKIYHKSTSPIFSFHFDAEDGLWIWVKDRNGYGLWIWVKDRNGWGNTAVRTIERSEGGRATT